MIFTDESGREYESIIIGDFAPLRDHMIIRPVKAEPKYYVGEPIQLHPGDAEWTFTVTLTLRASTSHSLLGKSGITGIIENAWSGLSGG